MSEKKWPTAITEIGQNKINIRGYPVEKLMGQATFAQVAYLAIFGELPDEKTGKMTDRGKKIIGAKMIIPLIVVGFDAVDGDGKIEFTFFKIVGIPH